MHGGPSKCQQRLLRPCAWSAVTSRLPRSNTMAVTFPCGLSSYSPGLKKAAFRSNPVKTPIVPEMRSFAANCRRQVQRRVILSAARWRR
jgi:hypothetical protein